MLHGEGGGYTYSNLNVGNGRGIFIHTRQTITYDSARSDRRVYRLFKMSRILRFRGTLNQWVPGSSPGGCTRRVRIPDWKPHLLVSVLVGVSFFFPVPESRPGQLQD